MYAGSVTKKHINLYGTGEFTILPYHNQWLYGRSALQVALNLLNHGFQFSREEKTDTKAWGGNHTPICPNGMKGDFTDIDRLTSSIGFILNYIPVKTMFNEAGLLGSFYLKDEPEMRKDFRMGDNNDGITIIDVVENKYCFMNISEFVREKGDRANSASDLTYLFPSSAHDYVRCYYGETVSTLNKYHVDRALERKVDPKGALALAKEFRNDNAKLVRQFAKFEVLTIDEVLAMFPEVQKEISKK